MYIEIIGELSAVETIATGSGIRELARLRKFYGRGRWRKRKGIARVRLIDGEIVLAVKYIGMRQQALVSVNSR